jgi:hypothetical protein
MNTRDEAEHSRAQVRGDNPDLASHLRMKRELEGRLNQRRERVTTGRAYLRSPAASRVSSGVWGLAVELTGGFRDLWLTCVPGFLKDRRDLGVGEEVLPALRIPVEEHPDPALLIGIAKGVRTLGPVLLSLLKTCS